ncbi:MAG: D-alanyl-D-alanine carboxypeptidase [Rhodobacteraceae bacterium]|nr:D-alanyl-D-alanine carboxypeptidase [Paracoccaceae bacterium]MAY44824.1 D-alanyl-D-alanine carboxypeptidase [Paracoccaceae bacterium]
MAVALLSALPAIAAPYAAMVIDARTGEVLHSRNADARLHPASLTKMMTLYIAFQAIENGEIGLDDQVRISAHAAAEPPSKLGLRAGQTIAFRYLIRAAAVKSANDCATAIGEAISGSEEAFARRMNATAKQLGMTRTTFKNANGLTREGHLSTARDMTTMGRHLLYDFPQYYNLFSRRSTDAGLRVVPNTNRRLLDSYQGADGIKTGYTSASGSNLVASAKRGDERIIVTVFGGTSSAARNAKVAELLDMGFKRAPSHAPLNKPTPPVYAGNALASVGAPAGTAGKTVRVSGGVAKSLRPMVRPLPVVTAAAASALQDQIDSLVATTASPGAAAPLEEGDASDDATVQLASLVPEARPEAEPEPEQEVVTRLSTKGDAHWGINVGRYNSRYQAEKVLLSTALSEMATLDGVDRQVVKSARGYDATFQGMTRDMADLACRRLQARNVTCFMMGPS